MLKSLRNLSDEEVVVFWSENPYAQDFWGEREMQWGLPCDASELTHFRKRIGTAGAEKILAATITLHGERAKEKEVVVDTTVQEKNITFPTDTKLAARIVRGGVKMAGRHGVKLRQSFERTVPKLLAAQRGAADQGRSGEGAQGGSALEDNRRAGDEATGCGGSRGKPGSTLGGNSKENPEPKALRQQENLLVARTGGSLHVQGQGAQKV
jgi:hypothetical protein